MILLYAQNITPRLNYVVQTILSAEVKITDDLEKYKLFEGLKLNYSAKKISTGEFHIRPFGLMEETDIHLLSVEFISWCNLSAFCMVESADIPFDIFSASFFLLSRYEEYLPHEKDEYGRYHHKNSLAFKHHFLHLPLINLWWVELNKIWKKRSKTTTSILKDTSFKFIPTYDIDIAYLSKGKSFQYNVASLIGSMLKFRKTDINNKLHYLLHKKDAYDTFGWLDGLHNQHQLKPIYFLLTIINRGTNDKNLSASTTALQELYKELGNYYNIGIHPSWQSGEEEGLMEKELDCLETVTCKPITQSRFHFLRFNLPEYYNKLIRLGIKEDYSMSYGSKNGVRASFANSFYWYDLKNETITDLLVHPFCFMEATAHFSERKTAQQALNDMNEKYELVKSVNGEFITLFHNHFLVDDRDWKAWRNMYQTFLNNKYSY